jgi:hypothetical protein
VLDRLPSDNDDDVQQVVREIRVVVNRQMSNTSQDHLLRRKTMNLVQSIPPTSSRGLLSSEEIIELSLKRRQSVSSIPIENNQQRTTPRTRKMISKWLKQEKASRHHDYIADKLMKSFWGYIPTQDSLSLTIESVFDSFYSRYFEALGLGADFHRGHRVLKSIRYDQIAPNSASLSKYLGRWLDGY